MVTASTEELVIKTALKHISEVHIRKPDEISPELKAKIEASIKLDQGGRLFKPTLNYKETLTEKVVLYFRNIKTDREILDLSRIFRDLLLDMLAIEILVFHYL